MTVHHRKIKMIQFSINTIEFNCQVQTWNVVNNTEMGDKQYAMCGGGSESEFREEGEPDYTLEMTVYADWRLDGISDFLTAHDGEIAEFTADWHPDIPGEHVRRTGRLYVKDPGMGGEARATETHEITLQIIGKPTYERVTA